MKKIVLCFVCCSFVLQLSGMHISNLPPHVIQHKIFQYLELKDAYFILLLVSKDMNSVSRNYLLNHNFKRSHEILIKPLSDKICSQKICSQENFLNICRGKEIIIRTEDLNGDDDSYGYYKYMFSKKERKLLRSIGKKEKKNKFKMFFCCWCNKRSKRGKRDFYFLSDLKFLDELHLSDCSIDPLILRKSLKKIENLRKLSISGNEDVKCDIWDGTFINDKPVNDKPVNDKPEEWKNLEEVSLKFCDISFKEIIAILNLLFLKSVSIYTSEIYSFLNGKDRSGIRGSVGEFVFDKEVGRFSIVHDCLWGWSECLLNESWKSKVHIPGDVSENVKEVSIKSNTNHRFCFDKRFLGFLDSLVNLEKLNISFYVALGVSEEDLYDFLLKKEVGIEGIEVVEDSDDSYLDDYEEDFEYRENNWEEECLARLSLKYAKFF